MRHLLGCIVGLIITIGLCACGPAPSRAEDRTDGRKLKEPEATYLTKGRWDDFAVYEFVPQGAPGFLCVYVREEKGVTMACFRR